ncbi:MAG: zinc-ribbon domain-containing protein [Candidatus Devosia phytovorans]|uniref:Zinc-ribbon domain-containing protein n=1 Tax=Candidatus Devosia phytovorans TaxID=3121372 RepID=A0AAJ6AZT5_9HYPH|nr:zinc-ribbon domain-containing protein [Devosia sp.]WEK04477.1 MAG: zinc-ribbon domain-containing protein [Devosia sp.]
MIITCPHCQTKYQVTYEAIGSAGRKVQCAHCQQAWQQKPLDPDAGATPEQKQASVAMTEDAMDDAIAAEADSVIVENARKLRQEKAAEEAQQRAAAAAAAVASKAEAAMLKKRQKDFLRRHSAMVADLPLARLRRTFRVMGVLALAGVLALGYFGRVQVVQQYPAMAGVYESLGLGVNVVGLDFSDVTTQQSSRDGREMLAVSAQIVGLETEPVPVPAVVVTLLDTHGQGIYEWSVTPSVRDLMAGERATFDTQLTLPPGDAASVRLSFAGGQSAPLQASTPADTHTSETAPATEDTGHTAPGATQDHAAPAASQEHSTPEHH